MNQTNNSLNERIAITEGWTWSEKRACFIERMTPYPQTHWFKPMLGGRYMDASLLYDWVGTLAGCAELMLKLNKHAKVQDQCWVWGQNTNRIVNGETDVYYCCKIDLSTRHFVKCFYSPPNRPGHCIGEAWLSVFEK